MIEDLIGPIFKLYGNPLRSLSLPDEGKEYVILTKRPNTPGTVVDIIDLPNNMVLLYNMLYRPSVLRKLNWMNMVSLKYFHFNLDDSWIMLQRDCVNLTGLRSKYFL